MEQDFMHKTQKKHDEQDRLMSELKRETERQTGTLNSVHAIVLSHDKFFKDIDVETLIHIIRSYKQNEDFKTVSTRYANVVAKFVAFIIALSVLIGAVIIIKQTVIDHIK